MRVLTRLTLVLDDPSQNHRLAALTNAYDILALRPTTEKLLQQACTSLECDLISLDFSQRLPCHLKHKLVGSALQRGLCFEICYSAGIMDVQARRNLINNSANLVRATRGGRGVIISSEAKKAVGVRAPFDVINLATLWGLSQERGRDAISGLARAVVVSAKMRRTSVKGVINVIDDGVGEEEKKEKEASAKAADGKGKRKQAPGTGDSAGPETQPLSKKARKRAAAKAAKEAASKSAG